jgi:cyclase
VNIDPKRNANGDWIVHINGGRTPTEHEALSWAKEMEQRGAGEIVLTSMDADGTRNGYDLPMLRAISAAVSIPVVASGGAGEPAHLYDAFAAGASAALAASIFHDDEYSIPVTKTYLASRGVPIRLSSPSLLKASAPCPTNRHAL